MASNETCPLYLRERGVYARKEKLDARSSSNSPWGLLCTKANDPLKITKWVTPGRTRVEHIESASPPRERTSSGHAGSAAWGQQRK
jgi:hypothetical protein